ncbi:MAG: Gfo/Idh/MocA family oxidoreductase [Kiritimatiellaeota bacterium]|nr:Gfo/Idh/MocA family oxidoreductase [Kiritimatiellota bacterium]
MGKELKLLLVGTGGWAAVHARACRLARNVELAGICGHRNRERLTALADEFGPVASDTDLAALLEEVRPDILDVACNPRWRVGPVRLAAACPSVKLVNLEKPLALTPGEAYEIARLCRENNLLLTVNHQKKFLPAWRKLKEMIAGGVLGSVSFMRATCRGNLLEQGTHIADMLLFYNDYAPVSWLMGQVADLEGLDKPQAAAPDASIAVLCFENGVRALFEAGNAGRFLSGETNKWYQFALEVSGDAGHAEVTLNRDLTWVDYRSGRTVRERSSWDDDYLQAQAAHLDSLAVYAADPGCGHVSDLEHSLQSFEVIMGIYASACTGGRVEFPCRFEDRLLDALRRSH